MILDQPIVIKPPPYTDPKTNKIIYPTDLVLKELILTYTDSPKHKKLVAKIDSIPWSLILTETDEEYDALGDYTCSVREQLVKTKLGPDPAGKLRSLFPPTLEEDPNGPGTILSQTIKSIGITMTPNCKCMYHAIMMNKNGVDWCQQNLETILGWIKEECENRKIPFVKPIVSIIVNQAINKSRKLNNVL
jgi:hypothetical protein